ncbi:late cornified envelope-like proline-rich protein 1 [Eupeodes corollae]|uniref:late cornified envelope-like proline-rich protein 1 n=1 Tax=Eupeodes corollae TaxID=290404 RepID=UPI002490FF23|nr:late cornified envelope-like proline-rich protein 1 [Eupeodes corollae]
MSHGIFVLFFGVLIGLTCAAKLKEPTTEKPQCVDNTLYAKHVCENQKDGEKLLVPGSCSDYYLCSKGVSEKKSCSKFFDPASKKCVSTSKCVEVDNTDCEIPTPPPCGVTPSTPATCECPATQAPPTCPVVTCIPPTCPPPVKCPAPKKCPPPPKCP